METCKLHSQALPTALIQPLADPASSRPGHSWSRESWSGGKLISWELIWWQVDRVRVDLVPIDLVTPNWTVLPQFFKHLGMRLTNLGMRLTWNEVQPGNKVREWKACFFTNGDQCKECGDLCNIMQHYATLHNITQYYTTRPDSIIAMRRIWLQVPTQIRSQSSFVAPCNHFREWKDYQESSLSVVTTMNLDHPIINVIVMWLFTTCMYHVLSTTIMCGYSAIWLVLSVYEYMELPSLCLSYPKR